MRATLGSVAGRKVTIDLFDADVNIRRKPKHVTQAMVFIHVGDQPPGPGERCSAKRLRPARACR